MENKNQKILVWRPKEMMKNLTIKELAVFFIQLETSFEEFDPKKKYNGGEILFNPKAFHNAYKLESGRNHNSFKSAITQMRESYKTDKILITKVQHKQQQKFAKIEKKYDKFDLIWGDILFEASSFEDPRKKKEEKTN